MIELVAPGLLDEIERRPSVQMGALLPMLSVIGRGLRDNRRRFVELAVSRFNTVSDAEIAALYLGAAFSVDPTAATTALMAKVDTLSADDQTALVERFLPRVFGDGYSSAEFCANIIPFQSLERLVWIAFRTIRVDDDRNRPSGAVYHPDGRDHAQNARSAVFNRLVNTRGRDTFNALRRLAENSECLIEPSRLQALALERAAKDSESTPWLPAEPLAFEQSHETAPHTARDLQLVALRRLDDIQYGLLHDDFARGSTVRALPNEPDVQNWVADRLRLMQGRAYSIEREPHVVGEKEPDIRFRAKASDASVAMEIKVAETWTLKQLEVALTNQLCKRYLRARDARHGILLLVYKKRRPRGWKDKGAFLGFDQVVKRLRALATQIAGAAPDSPQPEICVLNVSSCARWSEASTS